MSAVGSLVHLLAEPETVEGVMAASAYRFKNPIFVVHCQADQYRLVQLPAGTVFKSSGAKACRNGMIDGTCNRDVVQVFCRDLEERAEPIAEETSVDDFIITGAIVQDGVIATSIADAVDPNASVPGDIFVSRTQTRLPDYCF